MNWCKFWDRNTVLDLRIIRRVLSSFPKAAQLVRLGVPDRHPAPSSDKSNRDCIKQTPRRASNSPPSLQNYPVVLTASEPHWAGVLTGLSPRRAKADPGAYLFHSARKSAVLEPAPGDPQELIMHLFHFQWHPVDSCTLAVMSYRQLIFWKHLTDNVGLLCPRVPYHPGHTPAPVFPSVLGPQCQMWGTGWLMCQSCGQYSYPESWSREVCLC